MANDALSSSDQDFLERGIVNFIRITNKNKGKLFFALLLGGILGIAFSFTVTKKYTSKAELLPEFSSNKLGSLGSLASLAGIDASSTESDAVRPDLYPNIILSTPALKYLLFKPVVTVSDKKYPTLLSYFEELNDKKLAAGQLTKSSKDSSLLIQFSDEEINMLNQLKKSISANFDKKSGIVMMDVEMPDAKVAGITLANCIAYLKDYVTKYRLGKKGEKAEFMKSKVKQAKKRLNIAQQSLQQYRDRNRNLFLNTAKIEMQNLEMELSQAEAIYNDISRQYEQVQISENEQEPVIHVLEPPQVPVQKSSPRRILFAIVGSFAAAFLTLVFLLIRSKAIS